MINPATRSTGAFAIAKAPSQEIQLFDPPLDAIYTIEATAHIVDVPRRTILVYCKHQLLSPAVTDNGYYFDRQGIRALRRIEALRPICGDDLAGIKIILNLTDALERLHAQLRAASQNPAARNTPENAPGDRQHNSSRRTKAKTNQRRKKT
ncbi:MAG: MerR family transcriptional regulator, heat shock protein HspR [Verrucomicrobiota bacterium]